MPHQSPYGGLGPSRRILRCNACGRSDDVTYSDLLTHTRAGWPRCCGEVMGYFLEGRRPSATDDTDEHPKLPGG